MKFRAQIPNRAGFAFNGVFRDGETRRCGVCRDAHGTHYLRLELDNGKHGRFVEMAELAGWEPLP